MNRFLVMAMVLIFGLCGICYADKPTTYNKIERIHGNIKFNVKTSAELIKGDPLSTVIRYAPMVVTLYGTARTSDGGTKGIRVKREVGVLSGDPLAGRDLYDALPAWAKPLFKELYQEAIDNDISV